MHEKIGRLGYDLLSDLGQLIEKNKKQVLGVIDLNFFFQI